ncbi:MAG: DNA replication/repair protein RecF [Leptonema sp. (in: bacteria)]
MWIEFLNLENYRNYNSLEVGFSPFLNFLIGENASGKTNLLEALGYFVAFRSFRRINDQNLIQWNKNYFYLKIECWNSPFNLHQKNSYEVGVEFVNQSIKKKIKKNNKKINKISEILGNVLGVFFTPEDLIYIDSITNRRSFFDFLFSTIDFEYFTAYNEYQKCLKHRNELLKRINLGKSKVKELDFWDNRLMSNAEIILQKRMLYLKEYEEYFKNRISEISKEKDKLNIQIEIYEMAEYKKKFFDNRNKDIQTGTTNFGIHRDKISFLDNHFKDILLTFSQGQKRTTALSLKLAQYDFYKRIFNIKPILFVDDVIRELDQYRRKYFLEILLDCGQAFFTTPNFEDDMKIFKNIKDKECKIFKIINGSLENEF